MVEIVKAAEYGKLISGRTRIRTSYPSKEASWTPKNLQDTCFRCLRTLVTDLLDSMYRGLSGV